MSFWSNCSCKLIVWVEITTFLPVSAAAMDRRHQVGEALAHAGPGLDHQVILPFSIASATAMAIAICSARDS